MKEEWKVERTKGGRNRQRGKERRDGETKKTEAKQTAPEKELQDKDKDKDKRPRYMTKTMNNVRSVYERGGGSRHYFISRAVLSVR
jgi:hypothetical protein